jgi:predicted ArsR family transcriptional regulator
MDVPFVPDDDVLAAPVRARLFAALTALRRPATTAELAERTGRHPNTTRAQLNRLADAGLVELRRVRQRRGRPRDEWVVAPGARPGGGPPQAHGHLSAWLARGLGGRERAADVERIGREIGREIAPSASGRPVDAAVLDVLAALGFAPRAERGPDDVAFVLQTCPYRDAVSENPPLVCVLHRGVTQGLLDRLEPDARLVDFVPKDPAVAGCVIRIAPAA